jgi:hypothetical protein
MHRYNDNLKAKGSNNNNTSYSSGITSSSSSIGVGNNSSITSNGYSASTISEYRKQSAELRDAGNAEVAAKDAVSYKNMIQNKDVLIVCMRVQLMCHMDAVYDVMEGLASALKADVRQLQILSCSEVDETDSLFVMFSPMNATPPMQDMFTHQTEHLAQKLARRKVKRKHKAEVKNLPNLQKKLGEGVCLPNAESLVFMIQEMSRVSSP